MPCFAQKVAALERQCSSAGDASREAAEARKATEDALARVAALEQQLRDTQRESDAHRSALETAQGRVAELEKLHAADVVAVRDLKESSVRQVRWPLVG